jgi:hypothetical protein
MDEQDSPATAQQPNGADSPGLSGQEPSRSTRTPKSDPEQRLNGLMSSLGRRTAERDAARAERDAVQQELMSLREGLDSAFSERDAGPPPAQEPEPQPEPSPVSAEVSESSPQQAQQPAEERYTLAEAQAVLEARAPVGHIDANNPSRAANAVAQEPTLHDLRRQLDAGWDAHQRTLNEH